MGAIPCPEGILREGIFRFDKTGPNGNKIFENGHYGVDLYPKP